ncbi:MAG: manganese efflux pump [Defluviitaleaceae bacterium]|nr:manganese efflux pump [Defluviitaleaceae bacterium]
MLLSIFSGLVVSVDALFIGISLGLQKKCRFLYLAVINVFLLGLCIVGFFVAGQIYELIPFDPDLIVGFAFIALGLWTILQYFIFDYVSKRKGTTEEVNAAAKTIVIVGLVMSIEAMLITMGITFVLLPYSTMVIPITVALAHFGYSSLTFYLARTKHMQRIPLAFCHAISGLALIAYGLMALFVEFGEIAL